MLNKLKFFGLVLIFINIIFSCTEKSENDIFIRPINHATLVIEYKNDVIYIDPVGGKIAFNKNKPATLVLITDTHGDHLSNETLLELNTHETTKIIPQAVYDKLDTRLKNNTIILNNNEYHNIKDNITVEAIPMYNLREEALKFHPRGRGNGYIITLGEKRIYISGDTEDITEMRSLENIDIALICMNLPYTMTIESAASAVLDFKPKKVYPYHYRGENGLSDVSLFKKLIEDANISTEVIQLNWYK